jgi:hypothetical protein
MNADVTFLVLGSLALAFALGAAFAESRAAPRHRTLTERWTRAQGTVSRISNPYHLSRNRPRSGDRKRTVPVVRFRASDGVEYEFDDHCAPRQVGASVEIAYDPTLPSGARVANRRSGWGCAMILALAALAAFAWAFLGPR